MPGSKISSLTSEQMRAARARGESRSDWARVQRDAEADPAASAQNRAIGELLTRKPGRPVVGEPKQAISLRLPQSVLARWRASGPGWQTRAAAALAAAAPEETP